MKRVLWIVRDLVVCTLIHASVFAASTTYFERPETSFLWELYVAGIFIILNGYWLGYLPALLGFHWLREKLSVHTYMQTIALGAGCGLCIAAPLLVLFDSNSLTNWLAFTTSQQWMTLPTAALIGVGYGLFYRSLNNRLPFFSFISVASIFLCSFLQHERF